MVLPNETRQFEHRQHRDTGLCMANKRRLTINPPLTEAEFASFHAANPGLKIDRDPSGDIIIRRKNKGRDDYVDWLLSQQGTISSDIDLDQDRPSIGTENHGIAQDVEKLQALKALRDRLIRLRETSDGAHQSALNIAIRALISAIDILESLITHEQRVPQKVKNRDMDTYDQRRKFLNDAGQSAEKVLEELGGDPAGRVPEC